MHSATYSALLINVRHMRCHDRVERGLDPSMNWIGCKLRTFRLGWIGSAKMEPYRGGHKGSRGGQTLLKTTRKRTTQTKLHASKQRNISRAIYPTRENGEPETILGAYAGLGPVLCPLFTPVTHTSTINCVSNVTLKLKS